MYKTKIINFIICFGLFVIFATHFNEMEKIYMSKTRISHSTGRGQAYTNKIKNMVDLVWCWVILDSHFPGIDQNI